MASPIKMLRLSKGMETGQVVSWLKSVGESVKKEEALVEVETEKAVVELEAPSDGVLLNIVYTEGEDVPVGAVIGWVGQPGETISEKDSPSEATVSAASNKNLPVEKQSVSLGKMSTTDSGSKAKATPAVRHFAAAQGINLETLSSIEPGKRITKADVEAAIEARGQSKIDSKQNDDVECIALEGMRKIMSQRMAYSAHNCAAATTIVDVDMGAINVLKKSHPVTYTSVVIKAISLALRNYRILNASLEGDQILLHKRINVAVAVDSPKGMVVVTIAQADKKSLADVDKELRELTSQARQGGLKQKTMVQSTFTVTNSGVLGSLIFTPIINPPQSAILGMGKVQDTPVVRAGQVVIRPVIYLCLTYDHRLIEGGEAVRFLQAVKDNLEDPGNLVNKSSKV